MAIPVQDLVQANARYAQAFDQGDLAMPPAKQLAVLTCMDARVEPLAFLGLRLGDTHVIRNAGGRATPDAVRSLAISQRLLGTDAVLVIHHADCGMLTFSNDDIRARIKDESGQEAATAAASVDFLPFSDLAASVRLDVRTLRESPLIPESIPIYGFIYDVHTGKLAAVE